MRENSRCTAAVRMGAGRRHTIIIWEYLESKAHDMVAFARWDDTNHNNGYRVRYRADTARFEYGIGNEDGDAEIPVSATTFGEPSLRV